MATDDVVDWEWGAEMVETAEEAYKELIGVPGVNPWFVLGSLAGLRTRFDDGERTASLYKGIAAEYKAL